jgi:hypothetical protein
MILGYSCQTVLCGGNGVRNAGTRFEVS